jgi:mono/diheme cytochrome c family protein
MDLKYILLTHQVSVILFLLIYLIKTGLLLGNKTDGLTKFKKITRVPEMIVSVLFLATGIFLLTKLPSVNMLMVIKLVAVFASIPIAIIGFKKGNKMLAVVSVLLIIGAYGLAEVSHKQSTTAAPSATPTLSASPEMDGKALYTNYCTKCHGDDGKSGMMGATDLSTSKLDADGAKTVITKGRGNTMLPYEGTLTPEQIASLSTYIQSLKK